MPYLYIYIYIYRYFSHFAGLALNDAASCIHPTCRCRASQVLLLNVELELKAEKENAEIRIKDPSKYQVGGRYFRDDLLPCFFSSRLKS